VLIDQELGPFPDTSAIQLKISSGLVFCLFTLGGHGNFTAEVTMEQPDLLCTALALNIELLSIIVCAVL
jgi:hypothetical protein